VSCWTSTSAMATVVLPFRMLRLQGVEWMALVCSAFWEVRLSVRAIHNGFSAEDCDVGKLTFNVCTRQLSPPAGDRLSRREQLSADLIDKKISAPPTAPLRPVPAVCSCWISSTILLLIRALCNLIIHLPSLVILRQFLRKKPVARSYDRSQDGEHHGEDQGVRQPLNV
jgi:hypothetical protein